MTVLSQDLDSNVIWRGMIYVQWVQLKWEVIVRFVDIDGIDDHHCLNFLFIIEICWSIINLWTWKTYLALSIFNLFIQNGGCHIVLKENHFGLSQAESEDRGEINKNSVLLVPKTFVRCCIYLTTYYWIKTFLKIIEGSAIYGNLENKIWLLRMRFRPLTGRWLNVWPMAFLVNGHWIIQNRIEPVLVISLKG